MHDDVFFPASIIYFSAFVRKLCNISEVTALGISNKGASSYAQYIKMSAVRPTLRSSFSQYRHFTISQRGSLIQSSCCARISQRPISSRRFLHPNRSIVSTEHWNWSPSGFCSRRSFSTSSPLRHGHLTPPKPGEELVNLILVNSRSTNCPRRSVTIIDQQGHSHEFQVADSDNLLDIAQDGELEMEGACGGSCACSTCHVIVEDQDYYDKMEEPGDDENDMLDLAFGLTETSRLGCQVKMTKELDGLVVRLPSMTRNLQKSDFEKR